MIVAPIPLDLAERVVAAMSAFTTGYERLSRPARIELLTVLTLELARLVVEAQAIEGRP